MDFSNNAVLIQGVTLPEIEAMINRAVEKQMSDFYARLREDEPCLVKRKDAARMLGVSLPTIDAYSKSGILHPKHVGGRIFFKESELQSFKSR